jgi:hypothetical protein
MQERIENNIFLPPKKVKELKRDSLTKLGTATSKMSWQP